MGAHRGPCCVGDRYDCSGSFWPIRIIVYTGVLNCIRALGGYTQGQPAEVAFDTDSFVEKDYLSSICSKSGDMELAMNWWVPTSIVSCASDKGVGITHSRLAVVRFIERTWKLNIFKACWTILHWICGSSSRIGFSSLWDQKWIPQVRPKGIPL